jgi:hypothetical protein
MSQFLVQSSIPDKTAPDVTLSELTAVVTDPSAATPTTTVLTSTGAPLTFPVPAPCSISATFVEINAAGVRSVPSDPFVLAVPAITPPPKPGAFTLTLLGEVAPAPAPVA